MASAMTYTEIIWCCCCRHMFINVSSWQGVCYTCTSCRRKCLTTHVLCFV